MRKPGPIARRLVDLVTSCEALSFDETARLQQLWRKIFARRVHQTTGKWTYQKFDWHAFSYGFVYCVERAQAVVEYRTRRTSEIVVLPHRDEEPGYRCRSTAMPSLDGLDAYVCDPRFEWTMVFTHETDWCGPYFTTAEWAQTREPGKNRFRGP